MKDGAADDTVIERLQGALDGDTMPKAARDYAMHLLGRLSQPVRVSILGTPRSGKSELVNMFVGRRLIPKDAHLPTTEFVWAAEEAMTVTGADGSVNRYNAINMESLADGNAAFLKLELPVDILKRINLLEVVTNGAHEEIESAIDWAVRRTDIALWCSQAFDKSEQSVWARVPDSLKDHAFLVLTKADVLSAEKMLSKRVAELESVVAEEFHSLFAVATLQAVRATSGLSVDEAMFHASGGGALTSEILRHAERGRRADFDSAHMFLARYQVKDGDGSSRPVSMPLATQQPVPETPPAVPPPIPVIKDVAAVPPVVEEPVPQAAPVEIPVSENVPDVAADPAARETTAAPKPAAVAESVDLSPLPKVENPDLFLSSITYLKRRGEALSEEAKKLGEGEVKPLVEQCVDAVEHLVDLFSQDESGCDAADSFIDELSEASDMMVLMQVEDGDGPAADAVTLLVQLRRDMEMQLAA